MRDSDKRFSFFRGKIELIQPKEHKVSVDLILFLSKVKGVRKNSRVADLGAGFGFLSLVIAKKWGCEVHAIERDRKMLELLKENVRINGLEDRVRVVEEDVRRVENLYKRGYFDVVVSNPPFYPKEYGKEDGGFHFEGDTTLEDFVRASSYLLRDGGYLNLLIPSFRLYELFDLLRTHNLPPRFLSIIYPNVHKDGKLCVVNSIRNVPGPLRIEPPLVINEPGGSYTETVRGLLEGFL